MGKRRHLGDISAERFTRILERHFGCEVKWSTGRPVARICRRAAGGVYTQTFHLSTSFHSGLQRTVLHDLGFTDAEIDAAYPR